MIVPPYHRILLDKNASHTFFCIFHGADAIILCFDIKQHATLCALNYQWSEFCECRPLSNEDGYEDEEIEEYCSGVVGNKTDLVSSSMGSANFQKRSPSTFDELVPLSGSSTCSLVTPEDKRDWLVT